MTNSLKNIGLGASVLGLIALIRPWQWVKNAFVFAPLIFSGEFFNSTAFFQTSLATILFCIASSAVYIFNDIQDIDFDRQHSKKSHSRPLASGVVSKKAAFLLLIFLSLILIFGYFLMPNVMLVIGCYLLLNIAYSLVLKHQPVIDIFTIAIGFVLRVIVGSIALDLKISVWMCITTLCLALYLAAIKRRQELSQQGGGEGRAVLKKYSVELVNKYAEMSATGALLFYSIFVMSARSELVITIPLVLYGLFRYWYVVESLDAGESPTDALLVDWQLITVIVLWVAACIWALARVAQ
ncbi:decaprenyl-phosphate phosphoribosyltransferase [Polynucleobacter paneuropaeus]|nr:decaprenyl-phosphate phosphoribosyltransferase [Polynucleobacter paneuropaeus]